MEIVSLPAVGLGGKNKICSSLSSSFLKSFFAAKSLFKKQKPPHAVLAMGGFTAAPPVLAGKSLPRR